MGRVEAAGSDQLEYLAGVSQGIPLGGRLSAAARAEDLEAGRLELEFESRRRSVRSRVQGSFAAALYAQEAAKLQSEAASDAEKLVAVAQSLANAGETLALEVTRARVEWAKVRLERDRSQSLAQEALIELAASIGQAGLRIQAVEGSLEAALELPTLESIAEHPAVKAARAGVEVHEARLDLAKAQRIPDVNLELLYRRLDETEENAFDVGLSVTLPIFSNSVREARAERRAAQARADRSAVDLERDLQRAHVRLARALASLKALKEGLLAQQDEIARAYEARYSAGDASLADVLAARGDRIAVRLMHLEALREVLEAWAGLTPFRG